MRQYLRDFVRQAIITAFLAASPALPAAEFSQAVPADLLSLLTGSEFYRDLPPGFPAFSMPEGVRIIGAAASSGQRRVLLRSVPEGERAQRAITADLLASGWLDITRRPESDLGFIVADNDGNVADMLCHDDYGTLQVRGESGVENRIYLDLFARDDSDWQGCEPLIAARDGTIGGAQEPDVSLLAYLPRLEFPETPAGFRSFIPARVQRDGDSYETELTVPSSELDVAGLEAHYAAQLRAQGWRQDTAWTGELTAGSVWSYRPEGGDRSILLTLSVAWVADGVYALKLFMSELN